MVMTSRRNKVSRLRQDIFLLCSVLVILKACIQFWASLLKRPVKSLAGISRRLPRWSGASGMWPTWRGWRSWDYWTWQKEAKVQPNNCLQILADSYKDDEAKRFSLMSKACILGGFWFTSHGIRKESFNWRVVRHWNRSVLGGDGLARQNYSWPDLMYEMIAVLWTGSWSRWPLDMPFNQSSMILWYIVVFLWIEVPNILYDHSDLCVI